MPRLSDDQLEDIRGRTAFYRDWAADVYESNIYGIDDRRDLALRAALETK